MAGENPLKGFVKLWTENIKRAEERKEAFNKVAKMGLKFYDGPHDWIFDDYDHAGGGSPFRAPTGNVGIHAPDFKMTVNRVFELVSIFGPMLYSRNPTYTVNPRMYPDVPPDIWGSPELAQAMMMEEYGDKVRDQTVCALLTSYLNYLPNETGMAREVRRAINEALIKGVGALFTEVWQPEGSNTRMVRSKWTPIDDVVVDPDARCWEEIQWMAIRCQHSVRQVERMYGYPAGYLKGTINSSIQDSRDRASDRPASITKGKSYDYINYWKVYSKIGFGRADDEGGDLAGAQFLDEAAGDYVFLAIAEDVPHPLNMPPPMLELNPSIPDDQNALLNSVSWHVPHWADNAWPIEFLYFHTSPNELWPISHIKPALGEQFFIDWVYSMLATKLRVASLTRVGVSEDVSEETRKLMESPVDFVQVPMPTGKRPEDLFAEFRYGEFNKEIYNVAQMIESNFEKRTGLLGMLYGQQGENQMRSAAEATGLQQNLNIRPDDMRSQVEEWITQTGRRQALAARFMLEPQDVAPILGKRNAMLWSKLMGGVDLDTMVREYEYRIEGGSTVKPSPESTANYYEKNAQRVLPILQWAVQTMGPDNLPALNAFLKAMHRHGEGREFPYEIVAPAPPPMPEAIPPELMGQEGVPPEQPPMEVPEELMAAPQEQQAVEPPPPPQPQQPPINVTVAPPAVTINMDGQRQPMMQPQVNIAIPQGASDKPLPNGSMVQNPDGTWVFQAAKKGGKMFKNADGSWTFEVQSEQAA